MGNMTQVNQDDVAELRRQVDEKMRFKTVAFGFEKSSVNTFIQEQTALSNSRINTAEDAQKKAEEALFRLEECLKDRDKTIEALEASEAEAQRALNQSQEDLCNLKIDYEALTEKNNTLYGELASLSRSLEVKTFEKMRTDTENILCEKNALSARLSVLEKEREIMCESVTRLSAENLQLKDNLLKQENASALINRECHLAWGRLESLANLRGGDIASRLREAHDLLNVYMGMQSQCISDLKKLCKTQEIDEPVGQVIQAKTQ